MVDDEVQYEHQSVKVILAVIAPAPLKIPEGEKTPPVLTSSSFLPGGAEAVAAGAQYRAVSSAACINGTWTPQRADLTGWSACPARC